MYYLSMEFLMGRSLLNSLYNLDVAEPYAEALREMGYRWGVRYLVGAVRGFRGGLATEVVVLGSEIGPNA